MLSCNIVLPVVAKGEDAFKLGGQVEFFEVLRNRRAVRSFSNQRVEPSKVQQLVDSAVLAPSARNLERGHSRVS